MLGHQPLQQGGDDIVFRHPGDDMGIELLGFGTVTEVEDLLPVARLHIALAAATAGQQQARQRHNTQFSQAHGVPYHAGEAEFASQTKGP